MKTSTTVKWIAALMLAGGLTANAQVPGNEPPGIPPPDKPGWGHQGGPGDRDINPPRFEDIAKRMIEQFDADKDGKLDASELAKALAAQRHHPPPSGPKVDGMQDGPVPNK